MPPYKDIFEAAESTDEQAVRNFVEEKNVPVNATNYFEFTAAHIAAQKGNLNIVKYILEKDPSLLANKKCNGRVVLLMGVKYGHLDIVKYLVEDRNMSIEERFSNRYYGNTAIHIAVEYEQPQVLKYLLEERNGNVNVENDVQQTPVFLAMEHRYHSIAKYLIEERGAEINRKDYARDTILDKAVAEDDFVMVRYLINERKMRVTETWKNEYVHRAATFQRLDLLKYLVSELDADVNTIELFGKSPLHIAASHNYYDVCEYLIEHGANPNVVDEDGITPIQETEDERLIALLRNATKKRHRRNVFAPYSMPVETGARPAADFTKLERHSSWLRLGEEKLTRLTPSLNIDSFQFQNFLLLLGVLFKNFKNKIYQYRRSEESSPYFTQLAVDAVLQTDEHA